MKISAYLLEMAESIGLNIFNSEDMDWARHITWQCPHQKSMYKRRDPKSPRPMISVVCH